MTVEHRLEYKVANATGYRTNIVTTWDDTESERKALLAMRDGLRAAGFTAWVIKKTETDEVLP